jgi:AcrR family transcriptional regulator
MKQTDNPQISLKKQPKQERSKLLVTSIYDATARILERFGIDGTTTNRIAETTGISVGSLYQYFPNKDSILAKMIDRQAEIAGEWLKQILQENKNKSEDKFIEAVTHAVVDRLMNERQVLAPLFAEVFRLKKSREVLQARTKNLGVLVDFVQDRLQEQNRELLEKKLWVLGNASMGVIQAAMYEADQTLTRDELKAQLTKLSQSFLLNA